MKSDIPERGRSEKSVAQRVYGHIPVGMRHESRLALDPDSAEPHRQSLLEGVHIVAVAYSYIGIFHYAVLFTQK